MVIEEKSTITNKHSEISWEIVDFLNKCHHATYHTSPQKDYIKKNPFDVSVKLYETNSKVFQWAVKRIVEVLFTVTGLICISPLLVTIALAIKLDSKGPVLFKQKRVGQHGKEFYIYKFRSMYIDAEEKLKDLQKYNQTNELMFKMFNDPRITKVGKFLRKYSLDEFPQLFNVLRGEMSLVGFRPPLPSEVSKYQDVHYVRFAMMPGLTGPWQVNGRSKIKKFEEVINLEYEYTKNWSLFKDFEILMKTIPVVLFAKNTA